MKTYIADIIPKIQRFSRKIDDLTLLTNQHWVSLGDMINSKVVYIFRGNNQLLVSENGIITKGIWEYLGNQSLIIDKGNESYLLKKAFFDENVLALKVDGSNEFAFFVNETKYDKDLNSIYDVISFLEKAYLKKDDPQNLNDADGPTFEQPEFLFSKKLPEPNMWVQQMLLTNETTLVATMLNWRQFCDSHSKYYPLYTYQELRKRGVVISHKIHAALNEYAISMGYNSFSNMRREYFE